MKLIDALLELQRERLTVQLFTEYGRTNGSKLYLGYLPGRRWALC